LFEDCVINNRKDAPITAHHRPSPPITAHHRTSPHIARNMNKATIVVGLMLLKEARPKLLSCESIEPGFLNPKNLP
jgi:hypothetical protein